jgi:hypothetical protein
VAAGHVLRYRLLHKVTRGLEDRDHRSSGGVFGNKGVGVWDNDPTLKRNEDRRDDRSPCK